MTNPSGLPVEVTRAAADALGPDYNTSPRDRRKKVERVIAAAVAEPSLLPFLLTEAGYQHKEQNGFDWDGGFGPKIGIQPTSHDNLTTHRREVWLGPWSPVTDKETSE